MLYKLIYFFRTGREKPLVQDTAEIGQAYGRMRWSVISSITLGYALYYVCRLGLSVAKKPMIDDGVLTAEQLGYVSAAMSLTYAFGKFVNGFLADWSNVRRFMSFGLFISALVNLAFGFTSHFWFFVVLFALNGWFQSVGPGTSAVALSYWFGNKERGTYYGVWSMGHSMGESLTFLLTAMVISALGWRYGFWTASLMGGVGVVFIWLFLCDRPGTYGLPSIADYKNDHGDKVAGSADKIVSTKDDISTKQWEVLKNPAVWMLGLACASFSIVRYAITNWGVLYLQEEKAYSDVLAASIISANPLLGVMGTLLSGYISDKFFKGNRKVPSLIFGLLFVGSVSVFLLTPPGYLLIDILSMSIFGFVMGIQLCYLGGLMAIDICSKKASGAAMGMIGIFSYLAASLQDAVSGRFIEASKTVVNGVVKHDFGTVIFFWIGAALLSLFFVFSIWSVGQREE
ncbi:MAG: MFS transporter [Deltaproteobacteria bacterium]|nr:MFS transporter [Deltaproteobacteria bacterium]